MSAIRSVNAVGLLYRPTVELLASLFVSVSPLLCFIPLSPSAPLPPLPPLPRARYSGELDALKREVELLPH